jgi:hypothetical protein
MLRWLQELITEFRLKKDGYEIFFNAKGINLRKIK